MFKYLFALVATLSLGLPAVAQAQDLPSYARPAPISTDQNIHGRIVGYDGGYNLTVRDERGYVDTVRLHQGTIINPTGLRLEGGMIVSVLGYNAGGFFAANQIDTPYRFYGAVPYYAGHPWRYYGPAVSLDFFFGNPGWWHGGYFGGGYHFVGGARVYENVRFSTVYRGGAFRGRDFVAPREHGGYYGAARRSYYSRGGEHFDRHFR